jgi:hypothetical protein
MSACINNYRSLGREEGQGRQNLSIGTPPSSYTDALKPIRSRSKSRGPTRKPIGLNAKGKLSKKSLLQTRGGHIEQPRPVLAPCHAKPKEQFWV